jgi:hypothetical protein
MITPLCEETMKAFTKSVTYHVSSTILMFARNLITFFLIECLSISDGYINFIFNSSTRELILGTLSVVSELIEDIMHKVLLIVLSECNRCHVCLQQVSVVKDLILPPF